MLIIGLSGPEGAGKTTVAKLLTEKYGAAIIPFARPLKSMLAALGVPERCLYGSPADKEERLELLGGKSARWAMMTLGTEWGRDLISADLWANAWRASVLNSGSNIIVADDTRFHNEAAVIHSLKGVVWRVVRGNEGNNAAGMARHRSQEWVNLPVDIALVNDSSIESLVLQVDAALKIFKPETLKQAS